MSKIYLPINDFSSNSCYSIVDKDTIRAYKNQPNYNSTSDYTDYYINSHYLDKSGFTTWGNYSTLPICINSSRLTNEIYYRNDIPDIILLVFLLSIICFYFPFRVFKSFFKKSFI